MSIEDAERLALTTLKNIMEERLTADNIEILRITPAGYHNLPRDEVSALIAANTGRL